MIYSALSVIGMSIVVVGGYLNNFTVLVVGRVFFNIGLVKYFYNLNIEFL